MLFVLHLKCVVMRETFLPLLIQSTVVSCYLFRAYVNTLSLVVNETGRDKEKGEERKRGM